MKKFLAIILSIVMLLSMGIVGFSAFAADEEDAAYILTFNSTMNLSSNAISAPNVTYTYTLSNGDDGYYVYDNVNNTEAFLFPEDIDDFDLEADYLISDYGDSDDEYDIEDYDVTSIIAGDDADNIAVQTAEFTTGDYANEDHYVEETVTFDLSSLSFDDVGLYHYYLTETTTDEVTGLQEWFTVRELYITVKNDGDDGFVISNIAMYTRIATDWTVNEVDHAFYQSVKNSGFYHAYGIGGTDEFEVVDRNDGGTQEEIGWALDELLNKSLSEAGLYGQDFVVSLTAFGDMASTSKEFTFATVSANVDEGAVFEVVDGDGASQYIIQGEDNKFYYATQYKNSDSDTEYGYSNLNNDVFTLDLSDGQEYTILSVVEGMAFTVTISDSEFAGYSYYYRDYDNPDEDNAFFYVEDQSGSFTITYNIDEYDGDVFTWESTITGYDDFTVPEAERAYSVFEYWVDDDGSEYYVGEEYSVSDNLNLTAVFTQIEWQSGSSYTQTIDDVYADSFFEDTELIVYSTNNEGIDFAVVNGEDLDEDDDSDAGITYIEAIANTGVILEIAPYALMVLLAAAFVVLRTMSARKKQWA